MKVGDTVIRTVAGTMEMPLKVTELTDDIIVCGSWNFDRATGAEIDDDLNWGPPPKHTGSFLKEIVEEKKIPWTQIDSLPSE